jgi:hypothetical protein
VTDAQDSQPKKMQTLCFLYQNPVSKKSLSLVFEKLLQIQRLLPGSQTTRKTRVCRFLVKRRLKKRGPRFRSRKKYFKIMSLFLLTVGRLCRYYDIKQCRF